MEPLEKEFAVHWKCGSIGAAMIIHILRDYDCVARVSCPAGPEKGFPAKEIMSWFLLPKFEPQRKDGSACEGEFREGRIRLTLRGPEAPAAMREVEEFFGGPQP